MQLNNIVKFKRRNLTHTNNCVAFDDVAIGGRCEIFQFKDMKNGWSKIPNKIFLSQKIPSRGKLVLCVIIMHSMDKKTCFPSRPLIAKETGLNIRTVDKTIKFLEKKKFLIVDRTLKVNSYKINF